MIAARQGKEETEFYYVQESPLPLFFLSRRINTDSPEVRSRYDRAG
jgi:hypothetical protein